MAIRQHVVGADGIEHLIQFFASTQSDIIVDAVTEVVRLDVGKPYTLDDAVQIPSTIFWRMLKPPHAHFKHSFFVRNTYLQTKKKGKGAYSSS